MAKNCRASLRTTPYLKHCGFNHNAKLIFIKDQIEAINSKQVLMGGEL